MRFNIATGCACSLNDIFVRFPYEKFKTLIKKYKTKFQRREELKRVFRDGVNLMLEDIVENNVTIKLQGIGSQGAELHMEPFKFDEFERLRKKGKFKEVDFLESLFSGYLIHIYLHGKNDNFLHSKKVPIYVGKFLKDKITEYTNKGRGYC